jgi:hypothetical protein
VSLSYQFNSGSRASVTSRVAKGEYLNPPAVVSTFFDNNFNQVDTEARLRWAVSAITTADFHVTERSVSHPHVGARDFSGTVAGVDGSCALTGQTLLTASWSQALETYQTVDANYSRAERVSLGLDWQLQNKMALSLRTDASNVRYLGGPIPFLQSQRRDDLSNTSVVLTWTPRKQLTVSASVQSATRASNTPGVDYASNLTSLTAQVNF